MEAMVLGRDEGSLCKSIGNGRQLEHISEFHSPGFMLSESGTDGREC